MHRAVRLIIPLLIVAGCGSDGEDGGTLTREQFASEYPKEYCAWQFRCCESKERDFSNEADCVAAESKQIVSLLKKVEDDSFNGDAAYSLINKYKDTSCPRITFVDQLVYVTPTKTKGAGEACTSSLDCISLNCVGKICAKTGTKDGDPCNYIWDPWYPPCAAGFFCDGTLEVCSAKYADGQNCTSSYQCKSSVCAPTAKKCVSVSGYFCDGK